MENIVTTLVAETSDSPSTRVTSSTDLTGASVTGQLSGIMSDVQTLIRQQAEMLKAEVREDFQRSKRAAKFGALSIVCATVGALGLVTAVAYLLHEQFQIAMWASWGIVGGLSLLAGLVIGRVSYLLLESFNPMPLKSLHALEENLTFDTK
jgi:uncharacterized membrane protein YqjE